MTDVAKGVPSEESELVSRLSLEQKVRLLTGLDSWVLNGESAVGLRPMVLSDGPAGVRGTRFDSANPSTSLPSPIGMGATWDESAGATDPAEWQRLRDEIDAIVAHLYRLSRADFDHILGTFPLVFPDSEAGRAKRSALLAVYDQWAGKLG